MASVGRDNWNFCYYTKAGLKGFISLNALPKEGGHGKILYCATVSDEQGCDICQRDFDTLRQACDFLNRHYGHWEFVNLSQNREGCSSCVAKGLGA